MLDNLSISKRIWGGYATIVLLLVGIASFGYYAVSNLGQSLREYRQTSAQTVLANEYIDDLFQARIGSLKFRVNQSDASAAEVHENIAGITNDERLQETFENSPELKSEILALKGDAGSYAEAFGRLVEFQRQIERLNEQLAEVGLSTRMMLTEIMETAFADGDIEAAFYAGVAQQELMLGRLYMERFLRDNDPASFALVGQYLSSTADQMTILLDNLENPQRRNLANNVISNEILFLELAADVQTAITRRNAITDNELDRIGPDVQARFENVIDTSIAQQTTLGPEGQKFADRIVWLKPIVGVLAALAGLILAQVIGSSISRAVKDLANRTEKLATGDMSVDIKGAEHQHEIGQMARALGIFRDAELDRRNQAAREEQRTKEITKVVGLLSDALSQLAKGDLTVRMPENQSEEFRSLCANFNHSATQLQSIMSDVVEASGEIAAGTNNLASGSEQLAVRTERQASALAETTATITQIGSEIDDTAKKSKDTQALVQIAGSKAEKGREVVTKSVAAMDKIRKGSEEISKITSVIDDLAFQTNLLALNAGVEAARAGEEGRGFAVVAAEVRVLAQHAGEAAQRINQQITSSVKEVTEGASLADETSQALSEIAEMVETVNDAVSKISETAQNQAVGVKEINIAMTELDSLTQQNAAMVEETTAATMELKNEVTTLQTSAAILKLDGNTQFSSSVFDSETSADASWEAQLQAERDLATIAAQ